MTLADVFCKKAAPSINDLPEPLRRPFISGDVGVDQVPDALDQLTNSLVTKARRGRQLNAAGADEFRTYLRDYLNKYKDPLQDASWKATLAPHAPVTPAEVAMTGAMGIGLPWAVTNLAHHATQGLANVSQKSSPRAAANFRAISPNKVTLGESAKMLLSPKAIIPTALMSLLYTGINSYNDPLRQQGKRSLISSLGTTFDTETDKLMERQDEVRNRYGVAGVPLQVLHGMFNPLQSVYGAAKSLKEYLGTEKGASLLPRAEKQVAALIKAP